MRHVVPGLVVLSLVIGFGFVSNAYGAPPVSAKQVAPNFHGPFSEKEKGMDRVLLSPDPDVSSTTTDT
jgi:hypothetical protein